MQKDKTVAADTRNTANNIWKFKKTDYRLILGYWLIKPNKKALAVFTVKRPERSTSLMPRPQFFAQLVVLSWGFIKKV